MADIVQEVKKNFAFKNNFDVVLTFPAVMGNYSPPKAYANKVNIGDIKLELTNEYVGGDFRPANKLRDGGVSVTIDFNDTNDIDLYSRFAQVAMALEGQYPSDSYFVATIHKLNDYGKRSSNARSINLKKMFFNSVGNLSLDWGSSDLQTFTVTFIIDPKNITF